MQEGREDGLGKSDGGGSGGGKNKKKGFLNVELPSAMASSLSVVEVAAHRAKPGVQTPSRKEEQNGHVLPSSGVMERSPFEG